MNKYMKAYNVPILVCSLCFSNYSTAIELEPILDFLSCEPESGAGEYGWVINSPDDEVCLFAQYPDGVDKRPFVKINGKKIVLKKTGENKIPKNMKKDVITESFASLNKKIKIIVRYQSDYNSCDEIKEGCCGESFKGEIEVIDGVGINKKYKVTRWSGS